MTDSSPLVSVIIVTFNGRVHLERCLPALRHQTYQPIEVIVVDNNSSDGSAEFVQTEYPDVRYLQLDQNYGFAEANNRGIAVASGDLVWLLNNDTEPEPTALAALVSCCSADPEVGGVQSKLLLMDAPETLDSVGAFLTWSGYLYHYGIAKPDSDKYSYPIELYSAKGASFLLKKAALADTQLEDGSVFDPDFFAYFEETDLCHRLWLAGWSVKFCPSSKVLHKMGATSTLMQSSLVQFHAYKNRVASYLAVLPVTWLLRIMPIHLLLTEAFAVFSLVRFSRNGLAVFWAIQRALIWNLVHLPSTLAKRNWIAAQIAQVPTGSFLPRLTRSVPLSYYSSLVSGLEKFKDPIVYVK